jgi:pimeloyl-ACP methyl ester carboxylesterase
LKGIETEVRCGTVERPENPQAAAGRMLTIHFAVVPALAKNKAPDPLFVFAGGPGQAATRVAGALQATLAKINARRDIVYIDQRGTGQSNPLQCRRDSDRAAGSPSLREAVDPGASLEQLRTCIPTLAADTRWYTTSIAVGDFDAVRASLGAPAINLWGGSYGTRVALEYLHQFPQHVRSVVLDGVAPATLALPASFAIDGDAALNRLLADCERDHVCRERFPELTAKIDRLFAAAARSPRVTATQPLTGAPEALTLDATAVTSLLRAPLYAPQTAAMLPYALAQATQGDSTALLTLTSAFASSLAENFSEVMHFAVVCAEDLPRVDPAAIDAARRTRFGTVYIDLYRRACANFAPAAVPPGFYLAPSADVPVLMLSGGHDPATPPEHAAALAQSLPNVRHLIAPNLGHGVSGQGCAPELVTRFIRQANFDAIDGTCLEKIPAPPFFQPPGARP